MFYYREPNPYVYMWPFGHSAIGFVIAIIISKFTGEKINLPLVFTFSILPDIDLLFPSLLQHRGPTHSIILAVLLFVPILMIFRRGLPYLGALTSHSLIGDFFTYPPLQLFWPISKDWFVSPFRIWGTTHILVEATLFSIMLLFIFNNWKKK